MNETANAPIMENEHVRELLSILNDNGKDASGLTALLGYVTACENQLNKAMDDLTAMRYELGTMREEQDHPIKTALEKAARSLEATIAEMQKRLNEIKDKIVEGCKNAVSAFKEKGIAALNGLAKFFKIKPMFENLRRNLQSDIKRDQSVIAGIEKMSTQYHTAGMHLRNVGRAIRGKETITTIKPNGKLAKLAQSPFRSEMKCLNSVLRQVKGAIAALERLEKAVPQKTAPTRGGDKTDKQEYPSTLGTMKRLQKQIEAERAGVPVTVRVRRKQAEL